MLFKLAAIVAAISTLIAVGQTWRIGNMKDAAVVSRVELQACGVRLGNLIEDVESDNAIDKLDPGALRNVPDHWLQPLGQSGD